MRLQASREALIGLSRSGPSRWLLQGEFEADLDVERGREIAAALLDEGVELPATAAPTLPASRPATILAPPSLRR
jgi:hypothetical protein